MVERFNGLRLHTVISCDDQDRDVGDLGTTSTHSREGFVTGGVNKGDGPLTVMDLIRTNVLGDATGFAFNDVGVTNGIEQARLTVVHVTHDGDNGRTSNQVALIAFVFTKFKVKGLKQFAVFVFRRDDDNIEVEFSTQQHQSFVVNRLRCGDDLAQVEQNLHQRRGVAIDLLGEVSQRCTTGHANRFASTTRGNHATNRWGLQIIELLTPLLLGLATLGGTTAGTTKSTSSCTARVSTTRSAAATAATATARTTSKSAATRSASSTATARSTATSRCATATTRGCATASETATGCSTRSATGTRCRTRRHR